VAGTPILIIVGGLPATGKSTVASALVRQTGFAYVRVDRIEQAIIASAALRRPLGPVGYTVAYEVAAAPRLLEVELICTDQAAHRERARTREVDIQGPRTAELAADR